MCRQRLGKQGTRDLPAGIVDLTDVHPSYDLD
jgi:hypothetical protein